jgi:hypothetical protein
VGRICAVALESACRSITFARSIGMANPPRDFSSMTGKLIAPYLLHGEVSAVIPQDASDDAAPMS